MTTGTKPSSSAPRPGGSLGSVGTGLLAGAIVATTFHAEPDLLQSMALVLVALLAVGRDWQVKVAHLDRTARVLGEL